MAEGLDNVFRVHARQSVCIVEENESLRSQLSAAQARAETAERQVSALRAFAQVVLNDAHLLPIESLQAAVKYGLLLAPTAEKAWSALRPTPLLTGAEAPARAEGDTEKSKA
jgi:hypothetical protein